MRSSGQYSDLAAVLPQELVLEVFRKLDLAGRLAASHVCASWRRISLSNRRLWAEYTDRVRSQTRNNTKADVLSALLARSEPLPFFLDFKFDVPNSISELVIAHMGRMEDIYLGKLESDDALQRILAQDIPVMKHFAAMHELHGNTPMQLSTRWASAPRLESLGLVCQCIWPANCTFANLCSYSGDVPEGPGLDLSLSQMFPNVKVLSLHHFTSVSLPRLTPLPPSLTALRLWTDNKTIGVDCTALLRDCMASFPRELWIDRTHTASTVFEAIRLFQRLTKEPWRMFLYNDIIGLQAPLSDAPSHQYYVVCTDRSFPDRMAEMVPFSSRLCELDLRLPELLSLCSSDAALPALTSLSVLLGDLDDSSMSDSLQDMPGIQAPVLQLLRLRTGSRFDNPIGTLHGIVHAVHSPRLASILINTHHPDAFEHDEIIAFLVHAARLEIRTHRGEAVHVFEQSDSLHGRATGEPMY